MIARHVCAISAHRCPHEGPVQWHHAFGKDEDRRYIEPLILVPFCQPGCHQLGVHELLRSQGLDGPMRATPGLKVARLAVTFGWLGGDGQGEVVLPARFFVGCAELLGPLGRQLMEKEAEDA